MLVGVCFRGESVKKPVRMMFNEEIDHGFEVNDGATLSVNNPVSDEVGVLLNDDNQVQEANNQLYGVLDNTIITLSSISEFDGKRDWLAQQIAQSSSDSEDHYATTQTDGHRVERKNTIKELSQCLNN
jgi:hypothetical protein